ERAERRLVDLANALVARPVGPAPLHHQHEAFRLPAEPDELRLQAISQLFAPYVDPAMADAGRTLDALGLGRELLGACMVGLERTHEVDVVDPVQARVDEHRPVRRRLEALGGSLLDRILEREGAPEL